MQFQLPYIRCDRDLVCGGSQAENKISGVQMISDRKNETGFFQSLKTLEFYSNSVSAWGQVRKNEFATLTRDDGPLYACLRVFDGHSGILDECATLVLDGTQNSA